MRNCRLMKKRPTTRAFLENKVYLLRKCVGSFAVFCQHDEVPVVYQLTKGLGTSHNVELSSASYIVHGMCREQSELHSAGYVQGTERVT
jgi:hypothetical protein